MYRLALGSKEGFSEPCPRPLCLAIEHFRDTEAAISLSYLSATTVDNEAEPCSPIRGFRAV
ncbi:hypothetical protein CKAH01_12417 [Colletotrichum kahawae]|uniref:Uncharacterized protein n=1 Tax=Colletotrichum kahawae TaxID=34407 RepID=A0AAD9YTL6_COLKA|nr:hypothetical protein CKAH01_12417 [Colletotrichum kahawae]